MSENKTPVWELAGLDQTAWSKLPWKEMRKHLYRIGLISPVRYHFPTPFKWAFNFKLWWNRPKGGYLFAAYCKERAERHTVWFKWPFLTIDDNDKHYK